MPSAPPPVVRPAAAWFVLLDGGIVALGLLSSSRRAHAALSARLPLPPQRTLQQLLVATAFIHVGEAAHARRVARRKGLDGRGWALQTFIVGFPSLGRLRAQPSQPAQPA